MRSAFTNTIFFLAAMLAGCGTAPKSPLSLGLYGVPKEAMPEVKAAGFDVLYGSATSEYLDAARRADLKVLATSSVLARGATRAAVLDQLEKYDRHPALWGWYLIDEPDMHDVPPEKVDAAALFVQIRSKRPGVVTLASGN